MEKINVSRMYKKLSLYFLFFHISSVDFFKKIW